LSCLDPDELELTFVRLEFFFFSFYLEVVICAIIALYLIISLSPWLQPVAEDGSSSSKKC